MAGSEDEMEEEKKRSTKGKSFVDYIIDCCRKDNGVAAALRRADNPSTEYQSWSTLAGFHLDLEKSWERVPFAFIAAAVARAKIEENGTVPLCRALAVRYSDNEKAEGGPDEARLRRLLACTTVEECCRVLRPVVALVQNKDAGQVDYARLLDDLLWFYHDNTAVKARWAMDYYRRGETA